MFSRQMDDPTVASISSSFPASPCSPDEVAIRPDDCVEGGVEEWLEDEALPGFRVWQLAGIILSILLSVLIGLCCCVRFRVPRTKQEIEADYTRKKITKRFRNELAKISNTDMDEMDLRKALHRIQEEYDTETCELQNKYQEAMNKDLTRGTLQARFNTIMTGMQIHFTRREHRAFDSSMI